MPCSAYQARCSRSSGADLDDELTRCAVGEQIGLVPAHAPASSGAASARDGVHLVAAPCQRGERVAPDEAAGAREQHAAHGVRSPGYARSRSEIDALDAVGARPLDRERGVVPAHAARGLGHVAVAHLVEHLAVVGERLEAVREAGRDVEARRVLRAQLDAVPAAARGRVGAQVDGDVEDRAAHAAHELGLAVRLGLVVHAAQRAAARG